MNPQDQTKALATPVVSIGLECDKVLVKLNDDNLCKYVVQRDAYKTVMLCFQPKPNTYLYYGCNGETNSSQLFEYSHYTN